MRDWWAGYQQHRTVSLQHNLPELRGIEGQANVGRATRVDFTPQLEVEVQVLDPQVMVLVQSGKIASASLEFVPVETERRAYAGADLAEVYHRLSPEPEHTGLSLVDVPGVPGADLLALRALPALWAYAVVDPLVLNGEITDPDQVAQLAWLPHHDTRSHSVDETQLRRALEDLEQGRITIPPFASLTAGQVADRARAHLERHTHLGLGRSQRARPQKEGQMNKWIIARAAQLVAEGVAQADAEKQAKAAYEALTPEVRAKIEGTDEKVETETENRGLIARLLGLGRGDVHLHVTEPAPQPAQPVQARAEAKKAEDAEEATGDGDEADLNERIDQRIAALAKQPEHPMAAIASGIRVRSGKLEPEQLLTEVLTRTVLKQLRQQPVTAQDRQEVDNLLTGHGINTRALTIEGNGTVIFEELARQFVVKPSDDIVFRNHFRTVPMAGTRKVDFPRFDRNGLGFQWNRPSQGGSLSAITPTDPTLDTFPIEVAEMAGATIVADSFLHFNASGAAFVSQYLLPEFRGAAQAAEDHAFWLSNGSHPQPSTFRGFRHATGVTEAHPVTGSAVGVKFTEDVLNNMLRAMPAAFRSNPSRLAYYLPLARADDFAEIRAGRATNLGDQYAQDRSTIPGPTPVGRYRGIDVFGIPQLPDDEIFDQDGSVESGTAYLVHRDFVSIGDGLTLRIEVHRQPGFSSRIELQEFVGLGYEWPTSIVRHQGVQAKASS